MRSGFWSGLESIAEPWQICRFVLRMLDSHRAELRVCAMQADGSIWQTRDSAGLGPASHLPLDCLPSTHLAGCEDEDLESFVSGCEPQTWTAVIPLDALPAQTREVLRIAWDVYETGELDLSASDELNRLLLSLRATTWTPEPQVPVLH